MTLHVLVEGPSERAFLEPWSARLLQGYPVRVYPHQGKGKLPAHPNVAPDPRRRGLLDQLPAKLRGFATSLDPTKDGVVVLVDADDDDSATLAASIREVAAACGGAVRVFVSLAVEETEAFYLGDLKALKLAFPNADMTLARTYNPDSICGTAEYFGRIVRDGGLNKVAWGAAMGCVATTNPAQNRSPSFRTLLKGLLGLRPPAAHAERARAHRHPPKDRRDPGKRR
jgi:hypothetical protein